MKKQANNRFQSKLAAVLIALFTVIQTILPMPVRADADELEIGDFVYSVSREAILLYRGTATDVTVPAQLEADGTVYPVKAIAGRAFLGTQMAGGALTNVTIEDGITSIGAEAFAYNGLTGISLPASVTEVADGAFAYNEINGLDLSPAAGLASIGAGAFGYNRISSLTLPAGLKTIGNTAFTNNALSAVEIPAGITGIGAGAFNGNGRYVILSGGNDSVTSDVTAGEFGSVVKPVSVWIQGVDKEGGQVILSTREIPFDAAVEKPLADLQLAGNSVTLDAPYVAKYVADPLTVTLDEAHGQDNPYVIQYTLNDKLPVFEGLKTLSVQIGDPIDLRAGVTAKDSLGNDLTDRITISPETVDNSVENEYSVIYKVTDDSGNTAQETRKVLVGKDAMNLETGNGWLMKDFLYSGDGTILGLSDSGKEKLKTNTDLVLPSFDPTSPEGNAKIKKIAASSFNAGALGTGKLTNVTFPDTLEEIGSFAFQDNTIIDLKLPDSVKTVDTGAFSNSGIASVHLSENLKVIGSDAFANNRITEVMVPDSVEIVGRRAFLNNSISSLTLGKNLKTIDEQAFDHNKIDKVVLPESLESIGPSAFAHNELTFVNVPDTVKHLGYSAFPITGFLNILCRTESRRFRMDCSKTTGLRNWFFRNLSQRSGMKRFSATFLQK